MQRNIDYGKCCQELHFTSFSRKPRQACDDIHDIIRLQIFRSERLSKMKERI